jgi:hypothetical protein
MFAKMVAVKIGKLDKFGPNGPTVGWFKKFYNRHKEQIKLRKPSYIDRGRVAAASEKVVKDHVEKLKKELADGQIEQHAIWNCDETGFSGRIGAKPKKYIGKAEDRSMYAREVVSRDHITVHPCISASGVVMPPCIIFTKTYPSTAYAAEGPPGALYACSDCGHMTEEIYVKWFKDIFLQFCGQDRPQILIQDNHISHLSTAVIDLAIENNITMYYLPAHTSHITQPLDQMFSALKARYVALADTAPLLKSDLIITKQKFTPVLKYAYDIVFNPKSIKEAYRISGAFPPQLESIPEGKLLKDVTNTGSNHTDGVANTDTGKKMHMHTSTLNYYIK